MVLLLLHYHNSKKDDFFNFMTVSIQRSIIRSSDFELF